MLKLPLYCIILICKNPWHHLLTESGHLARLAGSDVALHMGVAQYCDLPMLHSPQKPPHWGKGSVSLDGHMFLCKIPAPPPQVTYRSVTSKVAFHV